MPDVSKGRVSLLTCFLTASAEFVLAIKASLW